MAAVKTITEAELLEALTLSRSDAPEHARTAAEIAKAAGVSRDVVNERIRALSEKGCVAVHTVYRINSAGRRAAIPAYTIKPVTDAIQDRA